MIQYPEGKLIARGVVTLGADNSKGNPFGYSAATDYDPSYDNKDATLFLLAVGREGPPLAARKLPAKDVKFPLVFELTTSDLIFPYTEDAWLKSTNSKDTIALTAIITPANRIAEPNDSERFGFGVSDPITFAGKLSRDSANINVEGKIDKGLFTPQEIAILSAVDTQLERLGTVKK